MPFTREEYERERRNFRWDIPENYNIAAVVDAHAREKGDKPCILWESETGEPLNVEPIEVFRKVFGVTIRDGYG